MPNDWRKFIRFTSKPDPDEDAVINMVNSALAADREYLGKECLSGDLEEYTRDFTVTIEVTPDKLYLDLSPRSGQGHDFQFSIIRESCRIDRSSMSVGEVLPEPEE